MWGLQRGYFAHDLRISEMQLQILTHCDITLRVVRGDEREPNAWEYNWATLFLGDINTATWPSRLGESQVRRLRVLRDSNL
jgi:hypothetical protein